MAWARVANLLRVGLVALLLAVELSTAVAFGAQPLFAAMYDDPSAFERALAKESLSPPTGHRVTGITVPHHLVAADLIARGFRCASGGTYERIILLSPITSGTRDCRLRRRAEPSRRSSVTWRATKPRSTPSLQGVQRSRNRPRSQKSTEFTRCFLSSQGSSPKRRLFQSPCASTRNARIGSCLWTR